MIVVVPRQVAIALDPDLVILGMIGIWGKDEAAFTARTGRTAHAGQAQEAQGKDRHCFNFRWIVESDRCGEGDSIVDKVNFSSKKKKRNPQKSDSLDANGNSDRGLS